MLYILAYMANKISEIRRFTPTALLSSIGFMILELYVGGRFFQWRSSRNNSRGIATKSTNVHIARAGSLLLLDVLTVAPNAMNTNQLAQFIPFSVGALIVIGARVYYST